MQLNLYTVIAWVILLYALGYSNDWTYGPAFLASIGPMCAFPSVIVYTIRQVSKSWRAVLTPKFYLKMLAICTVACSCCAAATASMLYVALALNVAGTAWIDFGIMGFLYPCVSFGTRMLITKACVSMATTFTRCINNEKTNKKGHGNEQRTDRAEFCTCCSVSGENV